MIKVFNRFSEVENFWDKIIRQSQTASFFQTFAWQKIWWQHFGQGKLWLLGIEAGPDLVGLASFEEKNEMLNFLGTNEVLGDELLTDFGDIVAKRGWEELCWRQIREFFQQTLDLHFVREDSPSLAILKKLGGQTKMEEVAPYLNLPSSWEDYLAFLPRKERQELQRKLRRLEKIGSFRVCRLDNKGCLSEFFRLLRLSSEPKERFLKPQMEDFFRDLVKVFLPKNLLDLCFLETEGKTVAATLAFSFQGPPAGEEVYLYNSGFDPTFAYLSPGLLLKAFLIKKAISEGKKRFDFLRGPERYKYDLGAKDQKLYQIRL